MDVNAIMIELGFDDLLFIHNLCRYLFCVEVHVCACVYRQKCFVAFHTELYYVCVDNVIES